MRVRRGLPDKVGFKAYSRGEQIISIAGESMVHLKTWRNQCGSSPRCEGEWWGNRDWELRFVLRNLLLFQEQCNTFGEFKIRGYIIRFVF